VTRLAELNLKIWLSQGKYPNPRKKSYKTVDSFSPNEATKHDKLKLKSKNPKLQPPKLNASPAGLVTLSMLQIFHSFGATNRQHCLVQLKEKSDECIIDTAIIANDPYQARILVLKRTLAQISPSSITINYGSKRKLALRLRRGNPLLHKERGI